MALTNRAYSVEMAAAGAELLVKRLDAEIEANNWHRLSETVKEMTGPTFDLVTGEKYWMIGVWARVGIEVEDEK
jgi:hypothetical protein